MRVVSLSRGILFRDIQNIYLKMLTFKRDQYEVVDTDEHTSPVECIRMPELTYIIKSSACTPECD